MRIRTKLLTLACVALGATTVVQASPSPPRPGQYKLSIGKYAEGTLTIRSVQSGLAEFDLTYWRCASQCQKTDQNFWSINNAVIEGGRIKLSGSTGKYTSDNEEDKDLGQCVLYFKLSRRSVSVQQATRCWWFGEGVDVTGIYRLQPHE